jgi:fumarate reductase flavoprotein subunit
MIDEGEVDLVVLGGGLAGLTAAVRASELGLRVTVLEQGGEERYPCNSRMSGGIFHVAYHEMKRPPAELLEVIRRATAGEADEAQARAIAEDAGRLVDWLRVQGARFIQIGALEWERWLLAPPRPLRAGLEWQGRGPDVLLRALAARLDRLGGTIRRGVRARSLQPAEDGIAVTAERDGRAQVFRGRAVVIADGGFQADPELFRAHIGPRPERVMQRGAANARGDGARMAQAIGAALTPMGRFYGHLLAQEAMTKDTLWPYPQLDSLAAAAIVVAADGRRPFDEGAGGVELANRIASSEDPAGTAVVFDAAIWEGPGRSSRIPTNPHLELGGATIHRAATLGGLAAQLGIEPDALARTVADYNAALASGRTAELKAPRRVDLHAAHPIVQAPFMAVRLCAGITHTMGGIAVDAHARVLRPDASPIGRLYAAGAATGGLEGGGATGGYVGGLCKAGIQGLRAAEHAAGSLGRGVGTSAGASR